MSGFTTTGASVLTNVEELSRSLLLWRQFTSWLGGIGIVVLALAVLPRLRVGGRQLLESEMPGPEIESLSTRIADTARRVWWLYLGLTVVLVAILTAFGLTGIDDEMTLFEAVAHAFATIPTGGFGTRLTSVAEFSAASQWAIALFMVLAGANFALMYHGARAAARAGLRARRGVPALSRRARARVDRDRRSSCSRTGSRPARRASARPSSRRSRS